MTPAAGRGRRCPSRTETIKTTSGGSEIVSGSWRKNPARWAAVSAISGLLAAVTALVTVYITTTAWREERGSRRPYFAITEPGIKLSTEKLPLRIQINIENVGSRPASDFTERLIMMNFDLSSEPQVKETTVANEIPVKIPQAWYLHGFDLPAKVGPKYFVYAISYTDRVLNKSFVQAFFMKWDGVARGKVSPDFVQVSKEEQRKLVSHLGSLLQDFK